MGPRCLNRNCVKQLPNLCKGSPGANSSRTTRKYTTNQWGRQCENSGHRRQPSPHLCQDIGDTDSGGSPHGQGPVEPRSKRPHSSPTRVADRWEDEIVALGRELVDAGLDAGAQTINVHLSRRHDDVPSVPTTGWRVIILIAGLGIQILGEDGSPLRTLTLDLTKDYQRQP